MRPSIFKDANAHDENVMWFFEYFNEDYTTWTEIIADIHLSYFRNRYYRACSVAYSYETKTGEPVLIFHKCGNVMMSKIYQDLQTEFTSMRLKIHNGTEYISFKDEAEQILFKLKYFA